MSWKVPTAVVVAVISIAMVVGHAVSQTQIYNVNRVDVRAAAGRIIAVHGRVISVEGNTFVLDDGTGSVLLSTCPSWYKKIDLGLGDAVTAVGQVAAVTLARSKPCKFAISVYRIEHGRSTIEVRPGPGVPPWLRERRAQL